MTARYSLLRLEAVNLRQVIDDTDELSVRRGGAYMLLKAVNQVAQRFEGALEPISLGASVGLFAVREGKPDDLRQKVADFLCIKHPFRHATFVVSVASGEDFARTVESCVAANRWQQMRSLSFATQWGQGTEVCGIDEIRPASSVDKRFKGQSCSASVAARASFGRRLRQNFYQTELDQADLPYTFTDDLEKLSAFNASDSAYAHLPATLSGKVAVFYADGNGFGNIQRACSTPDALREWDDEIKKKRRALLAELLKRLAATPLGKTTPSGTTAASALRLETLLWGGDELLFVLPGWLGLDFARCFFEISADWRHEGKPLSHAAGLVLAHHNAPIRQLQHLAKHLAEQAKDDGDKDRDTLSWVVLESFDTTGDDLQRYWQKSAVEDPSQPGAGWRKLRLKAEQLAALSACEPLKALLPRSALVRTLRSLAAGSAEAELSLIQSAYASTHAALDEAQSAILARLWTAFGTTWQPKPTAPPWADAVPLTALLNLWDYLQPAALAEESRHD